MMQNMFRSRVIVLGLVMIVLFMVSCVRPIAEEPALNASLLCTVDKDCVPDSCCHATGAVARAYGPDCSSVMCTMNCEPGTLDCAQGEVKCISSQCTVVMRETENDLQ